MTSTILITLCVLVLIAYFFDLTSSRTRVPSVILLLILGCALNYVVVYFGLGIPDLSPALPVLGTVGLILIVLEGALELELNRTKWRLIVKSFVTALLPMLVLTFGLAYLFSIAGGAGYRQCIISAIPFSVISSAVAIPTAKGLAKESREFVIYESSLSDILGVLMFNFFILNEDIGIEALQTFSVQLLMITALSFGATLGLAFLLSRIDHHIKFIPIILLVILIYAISKVYHLPGLIFILVFGLFLGNLDELKNYRWIRPLRPVEFSHEVIKFKDLTVEVTFLIRALFFILFGFLINTHELLNSGTILWAIVVTSSIFLLRAIQLIVLRIRLKPLLFIAPRGLISILLLLSINPSYLVFPAGRPLMTQVILLTAMVMMVGTLFGRRIAEGEVKRDLGNT